MTPEMTITPTPRVQPPRPPLTARRELRVRFRVPHRLPRRNSPPAATGLGREPQRPGALRIDVK